MGDFLHRRRGVVDRVHGRAAHGRPNTCGGTYRPCRFYGIVLDIPYLPYGGFAVKPYNPDLAGGKPYLRLVVSLAISWANTGCTCQLRTLTGIELDVVYHCTYRNIGDRQSVSGFDVGIRAGVDHVAVFEPDGAIM